jgi:hypothetical protein
MGDYQLCGFNANHNKCVVNQKEREGTRTKAIYNLHHNYSLYLCMLHVYMSHDG